MKRDCSTKKWWRLWWWMKCRGGGGDGSGGGGDGDDEGDGGEDDGGDGGGEGSDGGGDGGGEGGNSRFKWRYQYAPGSSFSSFRPAVADDGTINAVATGNYLVAVNPDGTEKWLVTGTTTGNEGVASGNGKVYTMKGDVVYAHDAADGTLVWQHDQSILAGSALDVAVGPDNSIYCATAGPGAFKLTDNGDSSSLDWYTPDPYKKGSPSSSEIRFGKSEDGSGHQMYYHNVRQMAMDADDGTKIFENYGSAVNQKPVPDITTNTFWTITTGVGTRAVKRLAGGSTEVCNYEFPNGTGVFEPVVGSSGNAYFIVGSNVIYSIDGSCNLNYAQRQSTNVYNPTLSPDESIMLVFSGGSGTSISLKIHGIDLNDGQELWSEELPLSDDEISHFVGSGASFSPDDTTAYFTTYRSPSTGAWVNAVSIA